MCLSIKMQVEQNVKLFHLYGIIKKRNKFKLVFTYNVIKNNISIKQCEQKQTISIIFINLAFDNNIILHNLLTIFLQLSNQIQTKHVELLFSLCYLYSQILLFFSLTVHFLCNYQRQKYSTKSFLKKLTVKI